MGILNLKVSRIITIVQFDLIKFTRDRTSFIIGILLPVVFTFFTGLAYSGQGGGEGSISVGITNYDNGSVSKFIIEEIKKDKTIALKFADEETLNKMITSGNLEAGIIISQDFSKDLSNNANPKVEIVRLPSAQGFQQVQNSFRAAFDKYTVKDNTIRYLKDKLKNTSQNLFDDTQIQKALDAEAVTKISIINPGTSLNSKDENKASSALGFMVMFIMYSVFFASGEVMQERKNNTLERLEMTSISKGEIVIGKFMGTLIRGWIQTIILIMFGKFVMGINFGNVFIAAVFMGTYLFCAVAGGNLLAYTLNSYEQMFAVTSVVVMATSALAGCWWPLEIVPTFMQSIAKLLPQYYAISGMKSIIKDGSMGGAVLISVTVLLGMGIGLIMLTIIMAREELGKVLSQRT